MESGTLNQTTLKMIREVLLSQWDPIGVVGLTEDVSDVEDEYDMYIPSIYRLMAMSASVAEIADHLERIEREKMCLTPQARGRLEGVATRLLDLSPRN